MTMQSRAALVGFTTLKKVAGVSITIRRGVSSAIVTAVPGDTLVDQEADDGRTVRLKIRDYIVLRTDFEAAVGVVGGDPARGDQFDETVADYTRTYEAIELGGEISRWWDKSGQVLRIHTIETIKITTTTGTTGGG